MGVFFYIIAFDKIHGLINAILFQVLFESKPNHLIAVCSHTQFDNIENCEGSCNYYCR